MNNKFAKAVLPAMVAVSSLGMGAALITAPAGASTTTTTKTTVVTKAPAVKSAAVTLAGTVTKVLPVKHTFWFKDGAKTYRAAYSTTTVFSKGSSTAIVKGLSVSVTGSFVGKSSTLIKATTIAA